MRRLKFFIVASGLALLLMSNSTQGALFNPIPGTPITNDLPNQH